MRMCCFLKRSYCFKLPLLRGKAAQHRNYLAVIITLFIFGITTIFGYLFFDSFVTQFQTTGYYTGPIEEAGEGFRSAIQFLDYIIVVIMAILIVGVGVTSFKVASHPVYFIITLVMAPFLGFVSLFFNYIFAQIVSDSVFLAVTAYFSRTILICTNLHWVMLVCIVVGSITLYGKRSKGQYL